MKISYTCYQQLGPQILNLVNTKNQSNGEKQESFSLLPFQNGFCKLQNFHIISYYVLSKQCQT
jgi:hypothetical protein